MKKFLVIAISFISLSTIAQSQSHTEEIQQYQDTLNAEYADPETSPLKPKDLRKFEGLDFFPINEKYSVSAKVNRTPNSKTFKMKTTTSRVSESSKYADLLFTIDGEEYSLEVYQDHGLMKVEEYKDYLFLPFLDDTNGETSYGGGRYIGLRIPEGDIIEIDFNKAYNPYCAYNERYSCPIVPRKNRLKTKIEAGVKTFEKD
jgi:uncharacterized protein